jgi:hypothetical protein
MDLMTVNRHPTRDQSDLLSSLKFIEHGEALNAEARPFSDPQEVLAHPAFDTGDKRAILASWASDACAVENLPNWRKLPETGALVALDDILDALQALDDGALH